MARDVKQPHTATPRQTPGALFAALASALLLAAYLLLPAISIMGACHAHGSTRHIALAVCRPILTIAGNSALYYDFLSWECKLFGVSPYELRVVMVAAMLQK